MAHSSNETQTSVADFLLRSLEELTEDELNKIKYNLTYLAYEKYQRIPRGHLEKLDRSGIADMMIRSYGEDGALSVMLEILKKMNQNNLVQRLSKDLQKGPQTGSELGDILQQNSCQLTLDPNTANGDLSLSEGNRKVTYMWGAKQPYPDHPERFECCPQVLCRESLTGRCYWEAEWSGVAWIGVTYKGIWRKGDGADCRLGYNDKSWSLYCDPDSYSVCHNDEQTLIPIEPSGSHRVGVCLDWGAGALSFYRVSSDGLTPLYRFTSSFTEPLYPGFLVFPESSVSL